MINLKKFKENVGVTKTQYVEKWLSEDLIPGVIKAPDTASTQFPDSARRPYEDRCKIKAKTNAIKIYAHIVKAAIKREHITNDMCHITKLEFDNYVDELKKAGLISLRLEDKVTYIDATLESNKIRKVEVGYIYKAILPLFEEVSKGITKACLDKIA